MNLSVIHVYPGVVSFSSCMVAGYRAVESEEEEPLVLDPLAEILAGSKGVATARAMSLVGPLVC